RASTHYDRRFLSSDPVGSVYRAPAARSSHLRQSVTRWPRQNKQTRERRLQGFSWGLSRIVSDRRPDASGMANRVRYGGRFRASKNRFHVPLRLAAAITGTCPTLYIAARHYW